MAKYLRVAKSFYEEYYSDLDEKIESFCNRYSEYRVASCSIATEKNGYTVSYVAIVVLEKEV